MAAPAPVDKQDPSKVTPQPPPPPPIKDQPVAPPSQTDRQYQVQKGDVIGDIATHFQVTPESIAAKNPTKIPDPSRITAGDDLTIPPTDPKVTAAQATVVAPSAPAKSSQQTATDAAVAKVANTPAQAGAAGKIQAQQDLDKAVAAEVDARLHPAPDASLTPAQRKDIQTTQLPESARASQIRQDIVGRYANQPAATNGVKAAVDRQEATALVASAAAPGSSPQGALTTLDQSLQRASSDQVRSIAATLPEYSKITADASAWINAPFQAAAPGDASANGAAAQDTSQRAADTIGSITSPTLSTKVTDGSRQALDKAAQFMPDGAAGVTTFANLSKVVGALHAQGSPNADGVRDSIASAVAARAAAPDESASAVSSNMNIALSNGADPALALATVDKVQIAQTPPPGTVPPGHSLPESVTPAGQLKSAVFTGMQQFSQQVDQDVNAYRTQYGELNSLIVKEGAGATPEDLNKVIEGYKADHPQWAADSKSVLDKLQADGHALSSQRDAAMSFLGAHPGDPQATGFLNNLLNDKENQSAIKLDATSDRTLLQGNASGEAMINNLALGSKALDQGARKFTQELGGLYVKNTMDSIRAGLGDSADAAGRAKAIESLDKLGNNRALGTVLGLGDNKVVDVKQATDALKTSLNELGKHAPGEAPDALKAAHVQNLEDVDAKLGKIKEFDKQTVAGVAFRGFSAAAAGLNLAAATQKAFGPSSGTEQTIQNWTSELVAAAGFSQKTANLVTTLGLTGPSNPFGPAIEKVGARIVDRSVNALSGAVDLWKAGDDFLKPGGDVTEGALRTVTGAGSLTWAFGTGSAAGPIGIAAVAVGTVGLIQYGDAKANDAAKPAREQFLKGLNFTDSAAKALAARHGANDQSPVSLLMKYGDAHGMHRAQTISWFNGLGTSAPGDKGRQAFFAGALTDAAGADPATFAKTAPDDAQFDARAADYSEGFSGNAFGTAPSIVYTQPDAANQRVSAHSTHQLDTILDKVLGTRPPGTP